MAWGRENGAAAKATWVTAEAIGSRKTHCWDLGRVARGDLSAGMLGQFPRASTDAVIARFWLDWGGLWRIIAPGGQKDRAVVEFAVDRPTYLQCAGADYALLEKALTDAQMEYVDPVVVTSNASSRGLEVKVTSRSRTAQDGVVDLVSVEEEKPAGWPTAQHFQSLGSGESKSFTFAMSDKTAVREVRVRVGDRQMQEVKAPVREG